MQGVLRAFGVFQQNTVKFYSTIFGVFFQINSNLFKKGIDKVLKNLQNKLMFKTKEYHAI